MPLKLSRLIGAIIMIIFGVIWMIMASSAGAPTYIMLFGLLFIALAVFVFLKILVSK